MGARLGGFKQLNPVVVGIAPDAMPIAAEIAQALEAPLDTVAIEPLAIGGGTSGTSHIGTAAEGGVVFFDPTQAQRIEDEAEAVDATLIDTQNRLEQRSSRWHQQDRRWSLNRRNVLLVGELLNDGQAAAAAACAVRDRGAAQVTYAAPKVRLATALSVADWMDEIVCLATVGHDVSAADCFERSEQVSDEQIRSMLHENETAQDQARKRNRR